MAPGLPALRELAKLEARMGHEALLHRLVLETEQDEHHYPRVGDFLHHEHLPFMGRLLHHVLQLTGLRARGRRNALAIEVRRNEVLLQRLPPSLDGCTLLHLSDLHLDAGARYLRALIDAVSGLAWHACVRARRHGGLHLGGLRLLGDRRALPLPAGGHAARAAQRRACPVATAFEPRTDLQRKEHLRFAGELAGFLEDGVQHGLCGSVRIFAASPFLGELKAKLGDGTRRLLAGTHDLDLCAVGPAEIGRRIAHAIVHEA